MFELIKKVFGKENDETQTTEDDALNAHLALAVLLMEAAYADGECSQKEKEQLSETLINHFGVDKKEINNLLERSDKAHKEYIDLFQYTRFINENFSRPRKMRIIESVWRIILLDGQLEAHEDHFVHKLANLLGFGHGDLINAKLKARKQLLDKPS